MAFSDLMWQLHFQEQKKLSLLQPPFFVFLEFLRFAACYNQIFKFVPSVCLLANDRVQPGGVALWNLEASQSTGFNNKVINTKLDILGFHFLHREEEVE